MSKVLTLERLSALIRYDPDSGVFLRRTEERGINGTGWRIAGSVKKGYRVITLDYVTYRANRLAWFAMTGSWPIGVVDHKDGDPLNDAFSNLRDVPQHMNAQNRRCANINKADGLPLGVYRCGSKTFRALLCVKGVKHKLGIYDSIEIAEKAYMKARRELAPGNLL